MMYTSQKKNQDSTLTVDQMVKKFLKLEFKMKKKKQRKEPKTITNSTTKVYRPLKQSLRVAAICLNALAKLRRRQSLSVEVKTVIATQ